MEDFYSWFAYVADKGGFTVVERGVAQYLVEQSTVIESVNLELSVDKLAKVLKCRKDTVTTSLKKLESSGVIARKRKGVIRLCSPPKTWLAKYSESFPGTFRGTIVGTVKKPPLNSCAQDEPSGLVTTTPKGVVTSSPNANQPATIDTSKNVKVVPISTISTPEVSSELERQHELPKLDLSKYRQALLKFGVSVD